MGNGKNMETDVAPPEGFVPLETPEPPQGFVPYEPKITRSFKSPEILMDRIKAGTDDGNRARQLSTLFFAEKFNKDPNTLNLSAQLKSYFGEDFEDQNPLQALKAIQQTIEPDEDENFTKILEFQEMSKDATEEEIFKYVQEIDQTHKPEIVAQYPHLQREMEEYKNALSPEARKAMVSRHRSKLLLSSPKALFLASDKILDKEAKRMARKTLVDKEMSLIDWAKLTKEQQEVFPLYMYYLNPKAAEDFFPEVVQRVKQATKRAGEAIISSADHMDMDAISSEKKLFYVYASKLGRDLQFNGKPLIDETGKFTSLEAEKEAHRILDEVYNKEANNVFNHIGAGLAPVKRPAKLKARYESYKKNLAENIYAGQDVHRQTGLTRKIKAITARRFEEGGLARQSITSGVDMGVDLAAAIGSGVVAGPVGAATYSFSRFYGEFTDTLIHDHKVDPTKAKVIAGITSIPYVALEYMQVKGLTGMPKNFAQSWSKGMGNHIKVATKEFAKNWTAETAQETAQAIIEAAGKAYAKEFAEAQGISYDQLMKDVGNEMIEAAKGMFSISFAGSLVKSGRSAIDYKRGYANFDIAEAQVKQAEKQIDPTLLIPEEKKDKVTVDILEEYQNSDNEQKSLIAEELELSTEQLDHEIEVQEERKILLEKSALELNSDREAELEALKEYDITQSAEQRRLSELSPEQKVQEFQEVYKDYADIVADGDNFKLVSKDSNTEIPIRFTDADAKGVWDGNEILIHKRGGEAVFGHEVTHAMVNLGLITPREFKDLGDIANKFYSKGEVNELVRAYKKQVDQDLTGDHLKDELIANMVEDIRTGRKAMPEANKSLMQKIIDFFRKIAGLEVTSKTLLKDVMAGKPLTKDMKIKKGKAKTEKKPNKKPESKDVPDEYYQGREAEESADQKAYEEYVKSEIKKDLAKKRADAIKRDYEENYEAKQYESELGKFNKTLEKDANSVRSYIRNNVGNKKVSYDAKFEKEARYLDVWRKVRPYLDKEAKKSYDEVMDDLGIHDMTDFIEQLANETDVRFSIDREGYEGDYPLADKGEWWGDSNYLAAGGKMVEMSPQEFLDNAKPLNLDEDAQENIDDLKSHIESGRALDPLVLYGGDKTNVRHSDGRHRAHLALQEGYETVPVIDYRDSPNVRFSIDRSQTETKAFKDWFGDSKVVDKDGKPKVMYHGTPNGDFNTFKEGSHFTDNQNYADNYQETSASSLGGSRKNKTNPKTFAVYLKIEKPFDTRLPENEDIFQGEFYRQWGTGTPLMESGLPDWNDALDLIEWIEETEQDFDGVIVDEGGLPDGTHRGYSWIPIKPTQIKSATGNKGTFDGSNPDIRYAIDRVQENNLIAVHNLSQSNINAVEELGALPAPSVAIIRADQDNGLGFGEISLIASPDLIDPEKEPKARTFDADIYSPRFPKNQIVYDIDRKVQNEIDEYINKEINELDESSLGGFGLNYDGFDNIHRSRALKLKYAREVKGAIKRLPKKERKKFPKSVTDMVKGKSFEELEELAKTKELQDELYKIPEIAKKIDHRRKRAESFADEERKNKHLNMIDYYFHTNAVEAQVSLKPPEIDRYKAFDLIDKKVTDEEVTIWAKKKWPNLIKEKKLFKGYNNSGIKKHEAYTLANIMKIMTKPPVQGGEGSPGPSQLRGQAANEFKYLENIQASRDSILPPGDKIEQIKEDLNQEFWNLAEDLEDFYQGDHNHGIAEALGEYLLYGPKKLYESFSKDVPRDKIDEYINKLRNAPTEYFETKFLRPVQLNEFNVALVPKGKRFDESANILKSHGLKVSRYKENEGRNFNSRNLGKFRFSLDRLNESAAVVIAKDFYDGDITNEQAVKIAKDMGVENPESTVFEAQKVAMQVQNQKLKVKTDREVVSAIKETQVMNEYSKKVDELYSQGHRQGEVYEKAKRAVAERREAFKKASVSAFKLPDAELYADGLYNAIQSESETSELINDLDRVIREELNTQGKDSKGNSPEVRGAMAKVYSEMATSLVKELTPSRRKDSIYKDIRNLKNYRMQSAIKSNFKKILDKIKSSAIKQTQKELRSELSKTLKKFKKVPKKGVEARKSTVHSSKHMFLYYGNKYKSLNADKYNAELESIKTELERYRDSDTESHKILFEELELKHQALVAFGSLDTQDATASEIHDGLDLANRVISDGKELVNRLEVAHQEKYAMASEDILKAVESAKQHVKKKDEKPLWNQLTQMNVRGQLESITAYGDVNEKAALEKILLANDAAKIKKFQMIEEYNQKLLDVAHEIYSQSDSDFTKNDLQKVMNKLSKEDKSLQVFSHEERTPLSRADLMTIFMAFRQQHVIDLATKLNNDSELVNPDLNRRLELMPEIKKVLTTEELTLAEKMGDILDELLPDVNKTFYKQYGVNLRVQPENYFPLNVQTKTGGFLQQMHTVSVAPSFTISRTSHSNDLNERSNIFEVFSSHIADAAHYVKTYDSQAGIRTTLTNRKFREAVRTTFGQSTLKYIDESVVDMAVDRALVPGEAVREIDAVRSWMSNISIGFNPKSALVAFTGTVNAFATNKGLLSSIKSAMQNPSEVIEDMKFIYNSVVVQKRMEQGLNEGMQNARQRAKGNNFIKLYQDLAFWGLTKVDSWTATVLGGIVYNQYKNSEMAAGLSKSEVEANGLALVNRAVQEAYQPTEADFLPADIRRGGSFAKSFFQFATEPKSKLGIYFRDIKQVSAEYKTGDKRKAVKDAINIAIGQHLVIPGAYWLAGELMRGMLWDDDYDSEEALRRLATGILLGPYSGMLVWGTGIEILAQTITGDRIFYGSSSVPSDRIMQEVGYLLKNITDDEKDLIEKIDKIIQRYVLMYKYTKEALSK